MKGFNIALELEVTWTTTTSVICYPLINKAKQHDYLQKCVPHTNLEYMPFILSFTENFSCIRMNLWDIEIAPKINTLFPPLLHNVLKLKLG